MKVLAETFAQQTFSWVESHIKRKVDKKESQKCNEHKRKEGKAQTNFKHDTNF